MSRPSSRASTSASINNRPPSSLNSFASYASTLTPGTKSSKAAARKFGGLTSRHHDELAKTIAKATPQRQSFVSEDSDGEEVTLQDKGKARAMPTGAFAERTSFANIPLVSRVVAASPHRKLALAKSTDRPPRQPRFLDALEAQDEAVDEANRTAAFEDEYQRQKEPIPDDLLLQEAYILEDLLHVLIGIEGQFIEYDSDYAPEDEVDRLNGARFVVNTGLDHSLRSLAERIVPLATHYMAIDAYVQKFCLLELGMVNHALSAALRDILREYLVLVTQLEYQFKHSPTFTLQRLWFYVQPMCKKFAILYQLVVELGAVPKDVDEDSDSEKLSDDDNTMGLPPGLANGKAKAQVGPIRGGEVLAVLESRILHDSGDPVAKELFEMLFSKASKPYANMLLDWITLGNLRDPCDEFIVREDKSRAKERLAQDYIDEYWEKRYTLKDASLGSRIISLEEARERGLSGSAIVPACLAAYRDKILLAGKYLNVIRECGKEIQTDSSSPSSDTDIDKPSFLARIDAAYSHANETLLKLLLEDQHFLDRLRSLKHYFFIDCGDAFTSFLDHAQPDLARPASTVSLSKLQNLLDMALRNPASASSSDPYKESVLAATSAKGVFDQMIHFNAIRGGTDVEPLSSAQSSSSSAAAKDMNGYEAFTIDYEIRFPLALVFTKKSILYYQLIFRFLLQVRHAEDELTSIWLEHAKSPVWRNPKPGSHRHPAIDRWKKRAFALRMHMLAFLQQLYSYAVAEVLEPRWREMVKKLQTIKTVDELIRIHLDFLNTCMKELLMTKNESLELIAKAIKACHMLKTYHANFTVGLAKAYKQLENANGDHTRVDFSTQDSTLAKFEKHFYFHVRALAKNTAYLSTTDTTAFISLHSRLDGLRVPKT